MQNGEQGIAVFLYFGPLMPGMRVLDGKGMQTEHLLHAVEFACERIAQRHPHEAIGALQVLGNLTDLEILELSAILVGDAAD